MTATLTTPETLRRVQKAVTAQPELFSPDLVVDEESGVASAARFLFKKRWEVTGKISTRDEEKAVRVLLCLRAGMSRRKIRDACQVHHYTIDQIEAAAEAGGNLEPLNNRIKTTLGRLVLEAAEETRAALHSEVRDLDAAAWLKATATALGISTDKHQLLTGAPTEILEHRSGPGRADLEAWLASSGLQVVTPATAVDVESPAPTPKSLPINCAVDLHTDGHTGSGSVQASGLPVPLEQGEGGGSPKPAGPTHADGSGTGQNFHE